MPGVLGIISRTKIDNGIIDRMIEELKHENWYKIDIHKGNFIALARVHLGTFNPLPQPIFNKSHTLCIFMDGKIYNNTHNLGEPEFCLQLYEEEGDDFVKKLNGAFIIVIYDLKAQKLLIANDRYGLLPHYYTVMGDSFLFSPEIKAILLHPSAKKELNPKAVADFLAFGECWGDETFFNNINILRPASILTYEGQKLSIKQYWEFKYVADYSISENKFVDELVHTFRNAVNLRIRDQNYRYCVSLSGGLDSRSIIGAIDDNSKVSTFSFGPLDSDEVKIAKKVTEVAGSKFLHSPITPELIIENAAKAVWLTEGRDYIGVSFTCPTCEPIKDIVDVVMEGYALDLTLGGSNSTCKVANCKNEIELKERLFKYRLFSDKEFDNLIHPDYSYKWKELATQSFETEFHRVEGDSLGDKCDNFFLRTKIPYISIGEALTRTVVELSFPTMDNELIDLLLKIPFKYRVNHYIYRKFLNKLCPELCKIPYSKTMVPASAPLFLWQMGRFYQIGKERVNQMLCSYSRGHLFLPNKRSYVNFDEWFRRDLGWQKYFIDLLLGHNTISKTYFNQEYIKYLLSSNVDGRSNNSRGLLYLATFELFLRQFEI
ncbi:MAG: hypothetical protein HY769_09900 [Candidatus Stahlbacteria bacterium]|nr:hypothetical protein [Candidatus Stahlbacteria bacterium]